MIKIKKAFTPILIFTFLCQGIVFAAPDSSTLRPPMQLNATAKNFIERQGADALKEETKDAAFIINNIVTPMEITLTDEERYNSWIQESPKDHLVLCRPKQLIQKEETSRFKGGFITLKHSKKFTLPDVYVSDQASYDLLSRYTYKWKEVNGRHVYIDGGYLFYDEGEPWIEYPYVSSSIRELLPSKRTVDQGL